MEQYRNYGGNSNVSKFEIGPDWIKVEFKDGTQYLYSYRVSGSANVEQMKKFAKSGEGLNTFISRNVRQNYERKLR